MKTLRTITERSREKMALTKKFESNDDEGVWELPGD